MNFPSKFLISSILIILVAITSSHAQTSGSGCNLDGRGIYITYLGTAPYYGSTDMRPVYSSSTAPGSFVPRNTMGYKDNGNHYNYMCGYINEFWSSYGPSQKELTERFPAVNCEVAASKNTPSGEAGHGRIYDFTYNNSTYCSGARPNNAPLDDYLPALVIALGMVGFFLIRDPLNPVVSLV